MPGPAVGLSLSVRTKVGRVPYITLDNGVDLCRASAARQGGPAELSVTIRRRNCGPKHSTFPVDRPLGPRIMTPSLTD